MLTGVIFLQLMNAWTIMVDVIRFVSTMMIPLSVGVGMATPYKVMEHPAVVRVQVFQC